jgi:hypothetical protein
MKRRTSSCASKNVVPVIVAAASVASMLCADAEVLPGIPGFPQMLQVNGMCGYDVSEVTEWLQSQRIMLPLGTVPA